jgi:hypothetical protein
VRRASAPPRWRIPAGCSSTRLVCFDCGAWLADAEGVDDEVRQVLNYRKIRLFCVSEHALRKTLGSWRTLSAPAQIGLSAATSPLFATTTVALGRLCKLFFDPAWLLEFHLDPSVRSLVGVKYDALGSCWRLDVEGC